MIFAKAKFTKWYGGIKYYTRKDWRKDCYVCRCPHIRPWKKDLKHQTAIKSRRAKLEDETPYKRFSDPWFYD